MQLSSQLKNQFDAKTDAQLLLAEREIIKQSLATVKSLGEKHGAMQACESPKIAVATQPTLLGSQNNDAGRKNGTATSLDELLEVVTTLDELIV